ncbi:hypothetical protein KFK09_028293 [Dendrobium nobile]|uniref:CCHC-type domain-containing protein n=1 Tax=Dendrobium nobile TaxID=94219 RepID=A0A8T3A358_DENNO|nr:hypothetical protein KFK09_028293 [Dendrobium nobile]
MTVDGRRPPVGGLNISGESDGLLGKKEERSRSFQQSKMDQGSSRKGANPLVIREVTDGPTKKVIKFVEGKGKSILDNSDCNSPIIEKNCSSSKPNDAEASSSDFKIFVKNFGYSNAISDPWPAINANTSNEVNENSNSVNKLHSVPCSDPFINPNFQSETRRFSSIVNSTKEGDTGLKTFSGNAWIKPQHIKLNYKMDSTPLSEDGIAVLMDSISEKANSQVLRNSLVIKVLGSNIPFPEAVEEILEGGPWYIGGSIIGLDKWSPNFSPETLKGLTAPIWIRLPCLPLHCLDEENICRIASKIGSPIYLDGNSFKWGKREYVRVCVRLNLDEKIPKGVWIEGSFQKVEYERISSLCYHCGKLGHTKNHCSLLINSSLVTAPEVIKKKVNSAEEIDKDYVQDELGPWIQVKFRKNRQSGSAYLKQKSNYLKTSSIKQKTIRQVYVPVQANLDREEGEIIEPIALEEEVLDHTEEGSKGLNHSSDKDASKSLLEPIKNCSTAAVEGEDINIEDKNVNIRSIIEADCMEKTNSHSEDIKGVGCISGGLMVCWRKDLVTFSILVASPQIIIGELYIANKGKWIIASVYGNNDLYKRKNLWNTLEGISNPVFTIIIGGDFNYILSQKDKLGGKRFKYTQGVQDFNNFISSCDLHELKFIGPRYTWCNNKTEAARIMERLDKCFLNSADLLSIINPVLKHLPRIASDHCPILVNLFNLAIHRKRFIKYEEVWSSYAASTDEVKRNGKELGIKIAPNVENISHLLYADDIVFFLKANGSCVKKAKEILNRYCKWTGQRINIQKSSILFGKSVKRKTKKRSSEILKFKVVQELKYLGFNIMLRRSARMDFSHLLNKANEYMNVWGNKYISLAGKILLVKSILSSFPIYHITHSLVPLSLLKEPDKMCRDFLWNKQDGSKGLHYISWEVLCEPLNLGGQGIQSLISKVKPLREKFAWKLISGDSSILYSILAAKKWGIAVPVFNSMEDCFVALSLMACNDPFTGNIYCSVVYLNWINRNKVTHESNEDCSSFIAANAFSMAIASFKNNSVYWETYQLSQLLSHWFPPPTEWVKLNIDAAIKNNYEAGIGGVLRDHKGIGMEDGGGGPSAIFDYGGDVFFYWWS